MKHLEKYNPIIFMLVISLAFFPLLAQEETEEAEESLESLLETVLEEEQEIEAEEAVEEDIETLLEAETEEEVEEEAVEEDIETLLEAETEEEVEEAAELIEEAIMEEEVMEEEIVEEEFAVSPLAGFTVGLNIGYPIITGEYLKNTETTGPNIGIIVGTPYGFPLGPFSIDVGAEILTYSWGDHYSGMALLGTVNTALNNLLPFELPGILSIQVGGGYFGAGLGTTIGGSFDYQVPNMPLFIKAYGRGNATTAAGGDDIADKPTGWINLGAIISYDISTLF